MPETKPVVIEIEDGETQDLLFRRGTHTAACEVGEWKANSCIVIYNRSLRPTGASEAPMFIPLRPDPVRAAEIAERERCRKSATDAVVGVLAPGNPLDDCRAAIIAAIDAPDETVSEYERGQREMRDRLIRKTTLWLPKHGEVLSRAEFQSMLTNFRQATIYTEPPA